MNDVIKMANNGQNKLQRNSIHPGSKDAIHPGQRVEKWKQEEFNATSKNRSLLTRTSPPANIAELNRRLTNVEEFLKMEFGEKYNK